MSAMVVFGGGEYRVFGVEMSYIFANRCAAATDRLYRR